MRGCTALLDAVGTAIEKMENVQKHLPEDHRAGKIIFVITTDGLENSSEHFTQEQIKRKIEAKKECGWEFLFLGAISKAVESDAMMDFMDDHWADEIEAYKEWKK